MDNSSFVSDTGRPLPPAVHYSCGRCQAAALATAALGLYWDVGWHIDFGRDKALFTPPHTMIVIGLAGIVYSAGIAALSPLSTTRRSRCAS